MVADGEGNAACGVSRAVSRCINAYVSLCVASVGVCLCKQKHKHTVAQESRLSCQPCSQKECVCPICGSRSAWLSVRYEELFFDVQQIAPDRSP
jgi:hypothetical protein